MATIAELEAQVKALKAAEYAKKAWKVETADGFGKGKNFVAKPVITFSKDGGRPITMGVGKIRAVLENIDAATAFLTAHQ